MGNSKSSSRGFTLIAALLMMVLLSGIAVGLMFMVTNQAHTGGNDLEDNLSYYGAESGMEKLTVDLASLYQASPTPQPAAIKNLTNFPPTTIGDLTYVENITWQADANGNPVSSFNTVSSGADQGLVAEMIPLTLQVTASRPSGASVNITRQVEVALIPVFQFGVFCEGDCSYFAGPQFNFAGRVHTNNNLFLASGSNLIFTDKISAFNEVIMDQLSNGWPTSSGYGGTVYVPNASGGCNTSWPSTHCVAMPVADASWSGGIPPAGAANSSWPGYSTGNPFKGFVVNGLTGAQNLQLPFVAPGVGPIQIIRKPVLGETATSPLGSSREYNKAAIRILLADENNPNDLHPERGPTPMDANDVDLGALATAGTTITVTGAPGTGKTVLATADTAVDGNWVKPINCTNCTTLGSGASAHTKWPLVDGWLRVEYLNAAGTWVGVTNEWLGLGFARDAAPHAVDAANTVAPNAILILQHVADRTTPGTGTAPTALSTTTNWYPINLWDPREGLPRDNATGPSGTLSGTQCYPNGVMGAVEIDVGNLNKWLKGAIGASGKLVNYTNENGYVLYFSDRRGMVPDPHVTPAPLTTGESGLEDVDNSSSANGTPDGILEATTYYKYSPEDVDQNGFLDNWGGTNIGWGFNIHTDTTPPNPWAAPLNCSTTGRANKVTGARHVLKLVDGGLGNLPTRLDNNLGGFSVASENPVYVQGNYNTSSADPYWSNPANNNTPHSAAAVIADTVTLLSNNWSDLNSLQNPLSLGSRSGTDTYYRMAVSAGKNLSFPHPSYAPGQDFGTDGGMHNFLRYVESWGGTLYYNGSLVSLYFAQYNTGIFKCCTMVYSPPNRQYSFDTLFLNPANLPPGTPMFQDVVNLGYHQNFTPQ